MSQESSTINSNLPPLPLPKGIESRYIALNGLIVHFLEAQSPPSDINSSKAPLIILVHGFPELAYSWRKIMRPLADLGFRVVAADQRGFGRTVPNPSLSTVANPYTYDDSLAPFRFTCHARDTVALAYALGYESVACIMGHDSGSITASSCALVRPDLFRSVVMMSAPFMGAPDLPFDLPSSPSFSDIQKEQGRASFGAQHAKSMLAMDAMLKNLSPPKIYYQHYYSLPQANTHMYSELSPNDMHSFIRAYFHIKSALWPSSSNTGVEAHFGAPRPLKGAEEIAFLPPYYLMPRGQSMPAVVRAYHPEGEDLERSRTWMTDADVGVYASEYGRTGFQGGLNRYRCATGIGRAGDTIDTISIAEEDYMTELTLFARKKIEIPALFVAGEKDWGPFQYPGGLEKMRAACPNMKEGNEGIVFIENAGHWVQQENPLELLENLKAFLNGLVY